MPEEPVLTVFLFATVAALAAGLGAFPFALGAGVQRTGIGIAYALASGLMLGASYLLASRGLDSDALWPVLGAGIGVAYTWSAQMFAGTAELHPDAEELPDGAQYGYKIILQNTFHAASEGLAIGVAMALELSLGIFMAVALAVHNIAEAMVLTSLLTKRGISLVQSTALCIATNSTQILLAVTTFALTEALSGWLPFALGMAAGAMVFLIMTELLPSSYQRCEKANVAFLVSAAAGTILVLEDFLV